MNTERSTVSLRFLLELALEEYARKEVQKLPAPQELQKLYPDMSGYDQAVWGTIEAARREEHNKQRKPLRIIKRTLLVAAVLVAIFSCALMTSATVRNTVVNTIIEWTGHNVGIAYETEGEPLTCLPEKYGPHYIPESLEYVEEQSWYETADGSFSYTYQSSDKKKILDIEVKISQNNSMYWLDNEHREFEQITFNDVPAYFGSWTSVLGDNGYTMVWTRNGIEHYLNGNISLSEFFEVAENIY